MDNLDILKKEMNEKRLLTYFLHAEETNIEDFTPESIAKLINQDCTICLCYGCRNFTHNCKESKISKEECFEYVKSYFSRDFNPDTDNCQCPSCRERRGEDNNIHTWELSLNGNVHYVFERNLPEAKSYAINQKYYDKMEYPYIEGILIS